MKTHPSAWHRLVTAARQATPVARDDAAPFGFATRVAALALAAEQPNLRTSLNRFSWRALGLALMLMLLSIAANYSAVTKVVNNEDDLVDPADIVLKLT